MDNKLKEAIKRHHESVTNGTLSNYGFGLSDNSIDRSWIESILIGMGRIEFVTSKLENEVNEYYRSLGV